MALVRVLAALWIAAFVCGCAGLGGGRSTLEFESTSLPHVLVPDLTTAVFESEGLNTAHVYMTDIEGLGTPEAEGAGMTGNVLHIHMFLYPKAGKTPIDFTASNATITHVVLADGAYGVYSGGGFLLPSGSPEKGERFSGRIAEATLRPVSATSGFADRLGWNELTGRVSAERDAERVGEIRAFVRPILANPELAPMRSPQRPLTSGEAEAVPKEE